MACRSLAPLLLGVVVFVVVTSTFGGIASAVPHAGSGGSTRSAAPPPAQRAMAPGEPPAAKVAPAPPIPSNVAAFDARVHATARALAAAGVPSGRYSLPNVGTPAKIVDGAVVPGPLIAPGYDAAPEGVAYYGESDPAGTLLTTTINASSVAGALDVDSLNTTYLDTDNPDVSGVQLNSILAGVTLQGTTGYNFWTQNALDYISQNSTLALGEDTWNFSSGGAYVPDDNSTISSHSPNGSVEAGIYIGFGPYLPAPTPFALTLYLNSSVSAGGDQELWYNYSLAASGEPYRSGGYDWLVFNSTNALHPATVAVAPFEASGTTSSPVGAPYDFEIDFGIAPYNGATMDTFSGSVSSTLSYCPASDAKCDPAQFRSVPAAMDFGSQTGETGEGLSFTYEGSTAFATGGPEILQGLWGFQGANGTAPGSTPVTNAITVSGGPDVGASTPYVFVFLNNTVMDSGFSWAPDVPTWHLMPGSYSYLLMLSDYETQYGTLTVGSAPTGLTATLPYSVGSGVYTPLWAVQNSQLAGISTSGTGTLASQYLLFNNPTSSCTACDGAPNGNLSAWFFDFNDYLYPTFPGVLLQGTTDYVDLTSPVSFTVYNETDEGSVPAVENWYFDLPIEFYHTSHVTLAGATDIGTWPTMFEILMVDYAPAAQNPFPQANVVVWDSTSDLIMGNRFGTESVPQDGTCGALCDVPLPCDFGCVSPDELMLYGGTNNTVWGNTFTDPPGTSLSTGGNALYAGLAEAESGDLIYNNNFSVDNPTMLMAYDIYNDSCWASYAGLCLPLFTPAYSDTWNVTNQSATDVARTVNGFGLSGNVLGPQYLRQGGNYWWNWGGSENAYSLLPFTNWFNYTQNVTNLPAGYPALESSIRVGGDYVPLRLGYLGGQCTVTFDESGLPAGTPWAVVLNGGTGTSTSTSISFAGLSSGSYSYTIDPVPGYQTPPGGEVTVATVATVTITFLPQPPAYLVAFEENGLPGGTEWEISLNGTPQSSSSAWINFTELPGSYPDVVGTLFWFDSVPASGAVLVSNSNQTLEIYFSHVLDQVLIGESNLPTGTNWSITLGDRTEWSTQSSIEFNVANGTYNYSVPSVAGFAGTSLTHSDSDLTGFRAASAGTYSGELQVYTRWVNGTLEFLKEQPTNSSGGGNNLLGLTASEWLGVVAIIVVVAAVIILVAWRGRKTKIPPTHPPQIPS